MTYSEIYEKITVVGFPADYYYAHIPSLDLTTHGPGIEGARDAAVDLVKLWLEGKKANGEPVPAETDTLFSQIGL